MLIEIEEILLKEKLDIVLVYRGVNSILVRIGKLKKIVEILLGYEQDCMDYQ